MQKVRVEKLPETKEIDGAKRWEEEKGEFVQISYGEEIRHLAYFVVREGFWRGKHYHEKKEEIFYVVAGEIRATFIDLDTDEKMDCMLTKGDRVRVKPRCWHIFYGIRDSSVVEYSPQIYDKGDAPRLEISIEHAESRE